MPTHGFAGNVRYGIEPPSPVLEIDRLPFPDFLSRVRQNAARTYHQVRGIGSDVIQDQQLLMMVPELEFNHDVCSLDLLEQCIRTVGVLPSLTFEVSRAQSGSNMADIWAGCQCASLRLSAAQREPLRAVSTWWPLGASVEAGQAWTIPNLPPFAFIQGTWTLGGEILGVEITMDNGLIRDQYISTAAPGDPFAPSFVLPGPMSVEARIRAYAMYNISELEDVIDAILTFTNGANVLHINLTGGAYHGQEHEMSGDALQEFGVPLIFANMTIT